MTNSEAIDKKQKHIFSLQLKLIHVLSDIDNLKDYGSFSQLAHLRTILSSAQNELHEAIMIASDESENKTIEAYGARH